MNTDKHRYKIKAAHSGLLKPIFFLSVSISVYLWIFLLSSCTSKPTDLRTLVPAETLVYLETNDLAAALQPIVDSKPFMEVAKSKPDFSALKGVQLAVAVTGFETSEEKLTDEHSVGRVQPHFVAVADTHAWNYQAVGFAEKKLGSFVENIYDSAPTLEKSDKNGGKYLTWTAKDGRKAYALVIDSLIYFGNDESAIDKCLAVKRGEADSFVKTGKVPQSDPKTLASGYVGPDGIAQIANIVGLKFASEAGEDSEVQSAIAGILPQLLRNSITETTWTATKTELGIEDKYQITMPADIANVLAETLASPSGPTEPLLFNRPLNDVPNITLYNLKSPQIAWRSVLLVAQKQTDPQAGKIIGEFAGVLLEPYGIRDVEKFLSGIGPNIITANFSSDGDRPIAIFRVTDLDMVKKSLSGSLKLTNTASEDFVSWESDEKDMGALFDPSINIIILGDLEGVRQIELAGIKTFADTDISKHLFTSKGVSVTISRDPELAARIVEMVSYKRSEEAAFSAIYSTETRFTKTGIERRTVSDFGLIGSIIAQLVQN